MFKVLAFPRIVGSRWDGLVQLTQNEPMVCYSDIDLDWLKQSLVRFPGIIILWGWLMRKACPLDYPLDLGSLGQFVNRDDIEKESYKRMLLLDKDDCYAWECLLSTIAINERFNDNGTIDLGCLGQFKYRDLWLRKTLSYLRKFPVSFLGYPYQGRTGERSKFRRTFVDIFGYFEPSQVSIPGVGKLSTGLTKRNWGKRLVEAQPNNIEFLLSYGFICLEEEDEPFPEGFKREVLANLEKAISCSNRDPDIFIVCARICIGGGFKIKDNALKQQGVRYLQQAMAIQPWRRYQELYASSEEREQFFSKLLRDFSTDMSLQVDPVAYVQSHLVQMIRYCEGLDKSIFLENAYGGLKQPEDVIKILYKDLFEFCADFNLTNINSSDGQLVRINDVKAGVNTVLNFKECVAKLVGFQKRRKYGPLELNEEEQIVQIQDSVYEEIARQLHYLFKGITEESSGNLSDCFSRSHNSIDFELLNFCSSKFSILYKLKQNGILPSYLEYGIYKVFRSVVENASTLSWSTLRRVGALIFATWQDFKFSSQVVMTFLLNASFSEAVKKGGPGEAREDFLIALAGLLAKLIDSDQKIRIPLYLRPLFDGLDEITAKHLIAFVEAYLEKFMSSPVFYCWAGSSCEDFIDSIDLYPYSAAFYLLLAQRMPLGTTAKIPYMLSQNTPIEICLKPLDFMPPCTQVMKVARTLMLRGDTLRLTHPYLRGLRDYCERMPLVRNLVAPLETLGQQLSPYMGQLSWLWQQQSGPVIQLPDGEVLDEEGVGELITRLETDRAMAVSEMQMGVGVRSRVVLRLGTDQIGGFDWGDDA